MAGRSKALFVVGQFCRVFFSAAQHRAPTHCRVLSNRRRIFRLQVVPANSPPQPQWPTLPHLRDCGLADRRGTTAKSARNFEKVREMDNGCLHLRILETFNQIKFGSLGPTQQQDTYINTHNQTPDGRRDKVAIVNSYPKMRFSALLLCLRKKNPKRK